MAYDVLDVVDRQASRYEPGRVGVPQKKNTLDALKLYEIAGANAPKVGIDRATIFREWGLMLRDSGAPDAAMQAEEKLEIALSANADDEITPHVLATCYEKRGAWRNVINVLEPLRETSR